LEQDRSLGCHQSAAALLSAAREKCCFGHVWQTAEIWDVATKNREASFGHDGDGRVLDAVFNRDETRVLTRSDEEAVSWDVSTEKQIGAYRHGDRVVSARFNDDGTRVVTASNDKSAAVWAAVPQRPGAASQSPLSAFPHKAWVSIAVFSGDGTRIVTASNDNATVWNVESKTSLATFLHKSPVQSAAFSEDGTRVLTASINRAEVWDVDTKKPLATFGESQVIESACFVRDGTRVLTTSNESAVLWDVATETQLATFQHEGRVWSAVFNKEETLVLTASEDHTAAIWQVPAVTSPAERVARASAVARSFGWCLTDQEREEHFLAAASAEQRTEECSDWVGSKMPADGGSPE
jgi:WD40 repeat protein